MALPPGTNTPFDPTNLVATPVPVPSGTATDRAPTGFANADAFNDLMNATSAPISPLASASSTSPNASNASSNGSSASPLPNFMDQVSSTYPKIDAAALQSGKNPLGAFTPNQSALVDKILNNSGPGARYQLDPVAIKQLEMRMSGLQEGQQALGQMTGIFPNGQTQGDMANSTVAGQSLSKPFSTFFGFITNGEKQLYGIEQELSALGGPEGKSLSPADMLRLQLKMSHVSQQLELFTGMLNKGLESSKTVLNTQI